MGTQRHQAATGSRRAVRQARGPGAVHALMLFKCLSGRRCPRHPELPTLSLPVATQTSTSAPSSGPATTSASTPRAASSACVAAATCSMGRPTAEVCSPPTRATFPPRHAPGRTATLTAPHNPALTLTLEGPARDLSKSGDGWAEALGQGQGRRRGRGQQAPPEYQASARWWA